MLTKYRKRRFRNENLARPSVKKKGTFPNLAKLAQTRLCIHRFILDIA